MTESSLSPVATSPKGMTSASLIARTRLIGELATPGEWHYRPRGHVIDDWGWVRASGDFPDGGWLVAQARSGAQPDEADENAHRRAGADPWGNNGQLIAFYRSAAPELADRLEAALAACASVRSLLGEARTEITRARRALAMFSARCGNTDAALALVDKALVTLPALAAAAELPADPDEPVAGVRGDMS